MKRIFALLVTLAIASVAVAQLQSRRVGVAWRRGTPAIEVSLEDLANERVREELRSGLRKRIVVTAQAFTVDGSRLIATRNFQCAVTYDLWQERFSVEIGSRVELFPTLSSVIDRCLNIDGMPVGRGEHYASLSGEAIYFAVRASFDPIEPARCRELLRSSGGSSDPIGPIVINIVRRDICSAERSVEVRSQEVRVP